MTNDEKRAILSQHLAKFRTWSYAELAERISSGDLETIEGLAPDGTDYQIECCVFWDDKPNGDVRVMGDFSRGKPA